MADRVDIFGYLDYRLFMTDFLAWKRDDRGLTFRAFAQKAGINSPNYLQQVIAGKRNLTTDSAAKVAAGFGLPRHQRAYFLELVQLSAAKTDRQRQEHLDQLKAHMARARRQSIKAPSLHASWLHAIVWEAAAVPALDMRPEELAARLRHLATPTEVQESLAFLSRQGWLEPTDDPRRYRQKPIDFEPLNDVRRLEIQQCHLRYLEVAKRRLIDPVASREFQSLTIAVPRARMSEVKEALRQLVQELNDRFSKLPGADALMQVQCAAFFLTQPLGPEEP